MKTYVYYGSGMFVNNKYTVTAKTKKDAIEKNPIRVEISFHCAFCF